MRHSPKQLHVHTIPGDIIPLEIPLEVYTFLSLGDKMVPTNSLPTWSKLFDTHTLFCTQLARAHVTSNSEDHLAGLRRTFLRKALGSDASNWRPGANKLGPSFDQFEYQTRVDIIERMQTLRAADSCHNNIELCDVAAMRWLDRNTHVVLDAPADKGLGSVLLSRRLYEDLAYGHLSSDKYAELSHSEALTLVCSLRNRIQGLSSDAELRRVIRSKHAQFLICLHDAAVRFPKFRQLIKILKDPSCFETYLSRTVLLYYTLVHLLIEVIETHYQQ